MTSDFDDLILVFVIFLINSFFVWFAWNTVAPLLFDLPPISFISAAVLKLLIWSLSKANDIISAKF